MILAVRGVLALLLCECTLRTVKVAVALCDEIRYVVAAVGMLRRALRCSAGVRRGADRRPCNGWLWRELSSKNTLTLFLTKRRWRKCLSVQVWPTGRAVFIL